MRIYIIRHGETDANVKGVLQGWSDYPLNESGVLLAEISGKNLSGVHFDAAFSSPLLRAKQTAELLLKNSGNENITVTTDDRIREICFGDWEGKRFKNGESEIPDENAKLLFTDPFGMGSSPNGESFRELCVRTQDFLKELAADARYQESNVLVATHGCALRAMLNFLYEDPADFWHGHVPYNCVVNIVKAENGKISLEADDVLYYDRSYCVDRYK